MIACKRYAGIVEYRSRIRGFVIAAILHVGVSVLGHKFKSLTEQRGIEILKITYPVLRLPLGVKRNTFVAENRFGILIVQLLIGEPADKMSGGHLVRNRKYKFFARIAVNGVYLAEVVLKEYGNRTFRYSIAEFTYKDIINKYRCRNVIGASAVGQTAET